MSNTEKRFAVLIDSDNVSPKYISYILDEVSDYGIATYKRIYGDWTKNSGWKNVLLENSILPMQQYSYTIGKNATDSAMIIDAMDILYSNHVDGFCLVSSDSDFTRLAARLRESGMFVLGIGERKTPVAFRSACNTFKILEVIAQEDEEEKPDFTDIKIIKKSIFKILDDNSNRGKMTSMSEIGNVLTKKYSDFDVRNYGYSKLSTFLESLEEFQIDKKGSNYIVYSKSATISKEEIMRCIKDIILEHNGLIDNLSVVKDELKKRYPEFNMKKYGYSKFSSFVKSFPQFEIVNDNEVKCR